MVSTPPTAESPPRISRSSAWIMAMLTRPPAWSRSVCVAVIVGIALFLGWIDYLTGPYISLRPFYYVPIVLSLAWFGWRMATVMSFACAAVWVLSDYFAGSPGVLGLSGLWNSVIAVVTFLIVVWMLELLLSLHRDMERRIAARTASLQTALEAQEKLRRDVIEVGARERNAVGRELHDGLCQHLTATAMATQVLADRLAGQGLPVADNARAIVGLMQEGITQSRRLASGLLLDAVAPERLAGELRSLASSVSQQSAVECRFEANGEQRLSDPATAAQLLRIAQEAVRNAVKHAKASRIHVTLAGNEQALRLEVTDNGVGLPSDGQRGGGMGLEIMAHRATSIGGLFALENLASGGTRVSCRVPLVAATN